MSKHTPEPWNKVQRKTLNIIIFNSAERYACSVALPHPIGGMLAELDMPEREANAARIVSSVNALAGIAEPEAWVEECKKLIAAVQLREFENWPGHFSAEDSVPDHLAAIKARIRTAETGKEPG